MRVPTSIQRNRRGVKPLVWAAFGITALLLFAWFGRGWLREQWYDYRDAQMRAEVPTPVILRPEGPKDPVRITETPRDSSSPPPEASEPQNDSKEEPPLQDDEKPDAINLKIPFVSQAPYRDWSMPYQEACEEASAIMASLYYQGDMREMVIGDAGDALLKKVIAWEEERFGYYKDTTVAETVIMLEEYFKLRARIVDDPTIEQIKQAVAAGYPVIVPAYGKALPNPYFKNGGPLYHMLVVKGYTETKFITHDPGTNTRGADFPYTYDALMNAIHDWNGGDVPNGAKRVIVVGGSVL